MRHIGLALLLISLPATAFAHPLVFGDPDGGLPPRSLAESIQRMDLIASVLSADDGIVQFNHLYETTTQNMATAIDAGQFEDAEFMTNFTVRFAGFYFQAVSENFSSDRQPPKAWLPLFERRGRAAEFKPVQFAMAGMDAHISRDLPVVLSILFQDGASFPAMNSSRHRDYLTVNQVLADTFEQLRDELLAGPTWFKVLGEGTALPWIRALRDKSWKDGAALWELRNHGTSRALYLDSLDAGTRVEAASGFLIRL